MAYASALLKQRQYGEAVEILVPVKDYPLARLEQAKAHCRKQAALDQTGCPADVREALDLRRYALAGLANGPERLGKFFSWLGHPAGTGR